MQPVLDASHRRREGLLWGVALGVLGLPSSKGLASYGQAVWMTVIGQRVIADVQTGLFARLMRADLAFFHANSTGSLISALHNDANLLRARRGHVLAGIGKDAVTIVFLVALMFYQDWVLALASFVVFPLAFRPIISIGRRMRRVLGNTQAELGQFNDVARPDLSRAPAHVKAYGMEIRVAARERLIERIVDLIKPGDADALGRLAPDGDAGRVRIAIVTLCGHRWSRA